jgi:hypothetical protein
MKTPITVTVLVLLAAGPLVGAAAAQAASPFCLYVTAFDEHVEMFALPIGGGQYVLTGRSLTFGDAYSGSGYAEGDLAEISLVSGLAPATVQATLALSTGGGDGFITFLDSGDIVDTGYEAYSPPCGP